MRGTVVRVAAVAAVLLGLAASAGPATARVGGQAKFTLSTDRLSRGATAVTIGHGQASGRAGRIVESPAEHDEGADVGEGAPPAGPPNPAASDVTLATPNATGFSGLTGVEQATLNNGSDLEPPDQALCVGNGFVVESVNLAIAVDRQDGTRLAQNDLNEFYGLPPLVTLDENGDPISAGPFLSDPKCIFDADTNRFFVTVLEIAVDPDTGNFLPNSSVLIAVSKSADPTGEWAVFTFDTTNAGGGATPLHRRCPCLSDQPLIGADANAFVVTTNEYGNFGRFNRFNGAQLFAMSKRTLAAAAVDTSLDVPLVRLENIRYGGRISSSLDPAIAPPGGEQAPGTEFLMSDGGRNSRRVDHVVNGKLFQKTVLWALTGTDTLDRPTPAVNLLFDTVPSVPYGQTELVPQRDGPRPLGDAVAAALGVPAPVGDIQPNDERINGTVVFQGGLVWAAANTIISDQNGEPRAGIVYWLVRPTFSPSGELRGKVEQQGYVAIDDGSVIFPSFGVNASGQAAMAFSVIKSKLNLFPSTGYVRMTATTPPGTVHVSGRGVAPQDGFTEYPVLCGGCSPRWGDYSATSVDADGTIWMAAEYIPGPRDFFINWGTFITHLTPS
jgi:hypothetical protein